LFKLIDELDEKKVIQNCKDLNNFYGGYDNGDASKKIVDVILRKMNKCLA
jgi:hypothetical protein